MLESPGIILMGASEWSNIYSEPHEIEYFFDIDGTAYGQSDIRGTPQIKRPFFKEPSFGIVASATLDLTVVPKGVIPKAAEVKAYCRLISSDHKKFTSWYPQGIYYISKRHKEGDRLVLSCRDGVIKTGRTYLDKTEFINWPVDCDLVVDEICELCELTLDSRTVLNSTIQVEYPNEFLMSEVLAMIGSAHGGNWVLTNEGKLRLIPFPDQRVQATAEDIGFSYRGYTAYSTGKQIVSRITLTDSAENQFSYGDDTGIEVGAVCEYATDAIAQNLYQTFGGAEFVPYKLNGAYISPLSEIGDRIQISTRGGDPLELVIGNMTFGCSPYFSATLEIGVQEDDEEEYPYISPADLKAKRVISVSQTYFGNRINRTEGFVSEYVQNNEIVAKMVANANEFSMKQKTENGWKDRIYFDPVAGQYVIDGSVTIKAMGTIEERVARAELAVEPGNIMATVTNSTQWGSVTASIQANADGLTTKVSKNGIIGEINNSGESIRIQANKIDISGAEISLTGKVSANNNVVIGQDGRITAVGGTFTSCTVTDNLQASNWTFGTLGMSYTNSQRGVSFAIHDNVDSIQLGAVGTTTIYGSDSTHDTYVKGRAVYVAGTANNQRVIVGQGQRPSGDYYNDACIYIEGAGSDDSSSRGNLGTGDCWWDYIYVRGISKSRADSYLSSRTRKKDIHDLPEFGEEIDALRPVSYKLISGDDSINYGLILEETMDIMPDICYIDKTYGMKASGIRYEMLIPVLLKEIQVLRKRVTALEG